jgi:hypothetical protein
MITFEDDNDDNDVSQENTASEDAMESGNGPNREDLLLTLKSAGTKRTLTAAPTRQPMRKKPKCTSPKKKKGSRPMAKVLKFVVATDQMRLDIWAKK